jgi:hypothetical protein
MLFGLGATGIVFSGVLFVSLLSVWVIASFKKRAEGTSLISQINLQKVWVASLLIALAIAIFGIGIPHFRMAMKLANLKEQFILIAETNKAATQSDGDDGTSDLKKVENERDRLLEHYRYRAIGTWDRERGFYALYIYEGFPFLPKSHDIHI